VSSRTVLVTGVGRRSGIAFAVARRLLAAGDRIVVSSWAPHDQAQPWGGDDVTAVLAALGNPPHVPIDLGQPDAPAELVARARAEVGPLSTLVAAHARSADGELATVTAAELDACWAVNARASVLLAQAFAAQYEPTAGPGRVLLFTSGQHQGPMPGELPYALSKAAIQGITATLAAALAPQGIAVTCLNPGPVDTGWADPGVHQVVAGRFPSGRWTTPDETAAVVDWLTGPEGMLVTGQTIDAEAGFRL
jgi:3-oxoacyl-[acyl-carrier protein] reductase